MRIIFYQSESSRFIIIYINLSLTFNIELDSHDFYTSSYLFRRQSESWSGSNLNISFLDSE